VDRIYKVALLLGLFAIAIGLFENSRNTRYQYANHGDQGVIVDTRTGEYWTEDGTHFEPREAKITTHSPTMVDARK
jgi:hypothetical protein